jgi:hypothetical protein
VASKSWERKQKESAQAFQAFCLYRDQKPEERSIRDVAKRLYKSYTIVGRWSTKFNWPHRVAEYDNYVDRVRLKAKESEIEKIAARQVRDIHASAVALTQVQTAFLQMLAENPAALANISPAKLADLSIRAAQVLPRLLQGEREAAVGGDGRFDKFNAKDEAASGDKSQQFAGVVFSLDKPEWVVEAERNEEKE